MKYLQLPYDEVRRLTFYLAMEEHAAQLLKDNKSIDELFFTWRVRPTVIFGRNQLIDSEVNVAYCKANGIEYYRRKSGGGCVYADMDNLMFSYITRSDDVTTTFARYTHAIVEMLKGLGLDASDNSRNDVMIEGKKVSGNAFYHIRGLGIGDRGLGGGNQKSGISIVHGTMLYDTNMEHMVGAITPSQEKLRSKGVESVRQHIALLKDYTDMSLEDFKLFVRSQLCHEEKVLDGDALAQIERIEKEYLSDAFIYGHNPRYTIVRRRRLEGVGDMEVRMELKNGIIKEMNLLGDFFIVGDLDLITHRLRGVSLTHEALTEALPDDLGSIILHLDRSSFINLLINP